MADAIAGRMGAKYLWVVFGGGREVLWWKGKGGKRGKGRVGGPGVLICVPLDGKRDPLSH
jgi:hypothetical protein